MSIHNPLMLVKLPCCTINLGLVSMIQFEPDPPLALLTWSTGTSKRLRGTDALALMDAVDQLAIDFSTPHPLELLEVE